MTTTTTSRGEIELLGCSPEPLAAYLKALGVFRIVAEQKDRHARASWQNDVFVFHTYLDRESLAAFFLEEYRPTPVIAPWNNRYKTAMRRGDREGIGVILASDSERFEEYKDVIEKSERWLDSEKNTILAECRNELPDLALPWLDAVYVLTTDRPDYPPLMSNGGTIGTSGSGDLSLNFMRNLALALNKNNVDKDWLNGALFNLDTPKIRGNTLGQFNPGGVGGPNATVGFQDEALTNPWDFVLMIEGAIFFAGAVARRLSPESRTKAVFPFTTYTSSAAYGTAVDGEYASDGPKGELWVPLWERAATYRELDYLFSEGRAQLGKRQAATGTDFARAVVGLGIEKGVSEFYRFGFLPRSGQGNIATPIGRLRVREDQKADLLFDLDSWLDRLRGANRGVRAPEGLGRVIRAIDGAIMDFCAHGESRYLQEVLVAVGRAEAWLSKSQVKERMRPLSGLSPQWLTDANDGSAEFRLAAALASIQHSKGRERSVSSIRENIEPVRFGRNGWEWQPDSTSYVWHGGSVIDAMTVVLQRRCMEANMHSIDQLPLEGKIGASLADIQAFLEGRVDERRIADLVLPLTAINWGDVTENTFGQTQDAQFLPNAYAMLKLLFLHYPLKRAGMEASIRAEPSILPLLKGGNTERAFDVAMRRLRASGLDTLIPGKSRYGRPTSVFAPNGMASRLAAALLFPINEPVERELDRLVLKQPQVND